MNTVTADFDILVKLVEESLEGDAVAFEQLVRMHIRSATAVALAVTGRIEDAEDVAQDAFILAYKKLHTCREAARFSGWLMQIVKNQAINWVSKRHRRESPDKPPDVYQLEKDDTSTETSTMEKQLLLKALSSLDCTQREIVLLHELEGWTHAELSTYLKISVEASRWHLFNARKIMKLELDGAYMLRKKVNNE